MCQLTKILVTALNISFEVKYILVCRWFNETKIKATDWLLKYRDFYQNCGYWVHEHLFLSQYKSLKLSQFYNLRAWELVIVEKLVVRVIRWVTTLKPRKTCTEKYCYIKILQNVLMIPVMNLKQLLYVLQFYKLCWDTSYKFKTLFYKCASETSDKYKTLFPQQCSSELTDD